MSIDCRSAILKADSDNKFNNFTFVSASIKSSLEIISNAKA